MPFSPRLSKTVSMAALLAALTLSGCSTGGLKSAFRDDPNIIKPAAMKPHEPTAMDAFRNLAPPAGMKFTPLFSEPMRNDSRRITRLEAEVQQLRDDLDLVATRLLRDRMPEAPVVSAEPLVEAPADAVPADAVPAHAVPVTPLPAETAPAMAVPVVKVPAVAAPVVVTPATPVVVAPAVVPEIGKIRALRIGDHGNKTRVVFDLSAKPNYSASIVNDDRQLVVTLPGIAWTIQRGWEARGGDLVSSYVYDGGTVALSLMSKSKIIQQSVIAGEGGNGYRLVIDIARINPL